MMSDDNVGWYTIYSNVNRYLNGINDIEKIIFAGTFLLSIVLTASCVIWRHIIFRFVHISCLHNCFSCIIVIIFLRV